MAKLMTPADDDSSASVPSPLAALSRSLEALEDRLARFAPRPEAPRARNRSERTAGPDMMDMAPAGSRHAGTSGTVLDDRPSAAGRRLSLSDAVSEIVMRRQMLDRTPRQPGAATAGRRTDVEAAAFESLRVEGGNYAVMAEVADELQRLRQELRRDRAALPDPRFAAMRRSFDELRRMVEVRASASSIRAELEYIADGLERLMMDGADGAMLRDLKIEFEGMSGLVADALREAAAHEAARRPEPVDARAASRQDLGEELARLRDSLRSLVSQDHIKAVETRVDAFEQRFRDGAAPAGQETLSAILREELQGLRDQVERMADRRSLEAMEEHWRALEERLDSRGLAADEEARRLAERMAEIDAALARMPESLGVAGFEERLRNLAEAVDAMARQNASHDAEQFGLIEERLDEISRAIVAASAQTPMIDMAPIERIEARIAALTARVDRIVDGEGAGNLAERIQDLSVRVEDLSNNPAMEELRQRVATIGERMETALADLETPRVDTAAMEARLAEMAKRLDEMVRPVGDSPLVQTLAAQIERLTDEIGRLQAPDREVVDLEFDRRLAAIEARLDDQRDALIAAAREVADETARRMEAAGDRRQSEHVAQLSASLRALEALSHEADERNGEVFQSLHATMLQIVDRLEQMEGELRAPPTREPTPAPAAVRPDIAAPATAPQAAPALERDPPAVRAKVSPASRLRGLLSRGAKTPAEAAAVEAAPPLPADRIDAVLGRGRERVTAPALDTADLLDRSEANRPLEPGSGAPDIGALLDRLELRRTKGAPASTGDAEALAAARRAAQNAAKELGVLEEASRAGDEGEKRGGLRGLLARRRKPILVAILAVITALAALPVKNAILGAAPEAGTELADRATPAPVASAPVDAVKAPAAAPARASAPPPPAPSVPVVPPRLEATLPAPAPSAAPSAVPPLAAPPVAVPPAASLPAAPLAAAAAPTPSAPAAPAQPRGAQVAMDSAALLTRVSQKLPASVSQPDIKVPEGVAAPALADAALAGDPKALFEIGLRLMEGRRGDPNPGEAIDWFGRAALKGFAPAQYSLGTLYEKGNGTPRDTEAARDWYRLAADQGNVRAMHNLAVLYATGIDGTSQPETALTWFAKAADYGMRDSQYNLGILYARGSGTDQDLMQSYQWFAIVARSGDKDAEAKQREVGKSLSAEQLKAADAAVAAFAAQTPPAGANTVDLPPAWSEKTDTTASVDMKRAIRNIQAILGKLGYDAGSPDGVMGDKTKEAITAFQRQSGLPATGSVDASLIRALLQRKDG